MEYNIVSFWWWWCNKIRNSITVTYPESCFRQNIFIRIKKSVLDKQTVLLSSLLHSQIQYKELWNTASRRQWTLVLSQATSRQAPRRGHREGRGLQVGKHKDVVTMKNKPQYAFHWVAGSEMQPERNKCGEFARYCFSKTTRHARIYIEGKVCDLVFPTNLIQNEECCLLGCGAV
jgi:hypothetical protein